MHNLSEQLGVPRKDALRVANRLLATTLVCPLGGEYEVVDCHAAPILRSSIWPPEQQGGTASDHRTPLLEWFRGVDLAVNKYPDRLEIHADLHMQRQKASRAFEFPSFKLFGGESKPPEKAADESTP
jgi:hypothetical protein